MFEPSWIGDDGLRYRTHCNECDTPNTDRDHICTPFCDKCGYRHDEDEKCVALCDECGCAHDTDPDAFVCSQ